MQSFLCHCFSYRFFDCLFSHRVVCLRKKYEESTFKPKTIENIFWLYAFIGIYIFYLVFSKYDALSLSILCEGGSMHTHERGNHGKTASEIKHKSNNINEMRFFFLICCCAVVRRNVLSTMCALYGIEYSPSLHFSFLFHSFFYLSKSIVIMVEKNKSFNAALLSLRQDLL